MDRRETTPVASAAKILLAALALAGCVGDNGDTSGEGSGETVFVVENAGLETPESVLYDAAADVYLVSNISGEGGAQDDAAFISRISPAGQVQALRWIDSAAAGVELNAPKGMAIFGEELFVADIDTVRIFNRGSGVPVANVEIAGAAFLNDVAADGQGNVYVSDSTKEVIYRIAPDRSWTTWAADDLLSEPNGVAVGGDDVVLVASSGSSKLYGLDAEGQTVGARDTPVGKLDGLVILADGGILFSSWDGGSVYRGGPIAADGFTLLYRELESPADIGFDPSRSRVLIPLFNLDKVVVKALP